MPAQHTSLPYRLRLELAVSRFQKCFYLVLLVGFGLELNQSSEFPMGFMGVKKFELNDGQYFEDGCYGEVV